MGSDSDDDATAVVRLGHSNLRTTRPPVTTVVSDFDLSRMPVIHRRTPHPWSVHCSVTTHKFIATLVRLDANHPKSSAGHVQFPFATEREARKFCKAYSPPKVAAVVAGNNDSMQPSLSCCCVLCQVPTTGATIPRHCRNCGALICERCTRRWGLRMLPKTFYYSSQAALTVRVCKSCVWLSNAFCMALLQGRYHDCLQLYDTVSAMYKNNVVGYQAHLT
jgi:hypothetical protein